MGKFYTVPRVTATMSNSGEKSKGFLSNQPVEGCIATVKDLRKDI